EIENLLRRGEIRVTHGKDGSTVVDILEPGSTFDALSEDSVEELFDQLTDGLTVSTTSSDHPAAELHALSQRKTVQEMRDSIEDEEDGVQVVIHTDEYGAFQKPHGTFSMRPMSRLRKDERKRD
ncbi:hypothetical protein AMTR_s00311p00007670, partial [Amborella trichopoda]